MCIALERRSDQQPVDAISLARMESGLDLKWPRQQDTFCVSDRLGYQKTWPSITILAANQPYPTLKVDPVFASYARCESASLKPHSDNMKNSTVD